jgi:hypothetical protein
MYTAISRLTGQQRSARTLTDGGRAVRGPSRRLSGDGVEAAAHVVADLQRILTTPLTVNGVEQQDIVTVGTALFARDGSTVRELIAAADDDTYAHKPPHRRRT